MDSDLADKVLILILDIGGNNVMIVEKMTLFGVR